MEKVKWGKWKASAGWIWRDGLCGNKPAEQGICIGVNSMVGVKKEHYNTAHHTFARRIARLLNQEDARKQTK